MSDILKSIARKQKVSQFIASSIKNHAPACIKNIENFLFDGEEIPENFSVETILSVLKNALERRTNTMVNDDRAIAKEKTDDDSFRTDRDNNIEALRKILFKVRKALIGIYGDDVVSLYGLDGTTPTDPNVLLSRAQNVVELIEEKPITRAPQFEAMTIDCTVLANSIKHGIIVLKNSLGAINDEVRENQLALKQRDISVDKWNVAYTNIANIVSSFFSLGERDDLAEVIRPKKRHSNGHTDEPEPEESVSDTSEE